MALNIKDPETERLAADVAAMTGESKTRAVRVALEQRRERLRAEHEAAVRAERAHRFLEREVWPNLPADVRGRTITKEEREELLGYGPDGV
ncbi:MAG: type II toxin-antitoxin system VapB family antitoxin [Candidatus Dormibacteraeota bacterium]|nr:type II toxin-antitoxin system VapB family antitoxin [Candidatus Dormibacteraeota bacterium]